MQPNIRTIALVMLSFVVACDDASPVAPIQNLPPLQTAIWHVHVSDGQAMPALLGQRTIAGNVLEQDFLDSSRVEIDRDGSWEHKAWYQQFRGGEHYAWVSTLDWGTWTATPTGYEFRRNTGESLYTLTGSVGDSMRLNLVYPNQDGAAVSLLRRTLPPATIHGQWRATALGGQPLPAAYWVEPEFETDGGIVSRHVVIDSASVFLYANDRYLHRIFYSEWEGPANGERQTKLQSFMATDFGSWTKSGLTMTLSSAWLQNHVMTGEAAANIVGPLRLNHGISHGDEPAAFRYVRQ